MHDTQLNIPELVLPDNQVMVAQLKIKLKIYQRRLATLKKYYKHHQNDPLGEQTILGAWYVIEILEQLLATGQVKPQPCFNDLTHRQHKAGYGKKPYPKIFAAWMHILHHYVSYRMPIPLNIRRLHSMRACH